MRAFTRTLLLSSAGCFALTALPAAAQVSESEAVDPEAEVGRSNGSSNAIIVTARRREETSINAPVQIQAISGDQLQARGINSVDSLAQAVPTLITSEATSSPQGGIVAIRGLSGVDANPFADQAVSFNIDGVPVARSSVRRLGQFDVAQIEVLKGPQSLFFGKNSPAGIITTRTNDPKGYFEAGIIAGYEFEADEIRTEGYVSGPVTDTLGVRLAGFYSHSEGDIRNVAPDGGANVFVPFDRRVPNGDEYAARATALFEPGDRFDARFKVAHNRSNTSGSTDVLQFVDCPLGIPQGTPAGYDTPEDCVADGRVTATDNIGPNFQNLDSRFGEETYLKSQQTLASLEMNYQLSDAFTLSSITGFYDAGNSYVGSFTANFLENGIPLTFLPAYADLEIREVTEEIRLTSDLDGPFNFLVGGLIQDSRGEAQALVSFNAYNPFPRSNYRYVQNGTAYSIFGQVSYEFLDSFELSAGARYSKEEKSLPVFESALSSDFDNLLNIEAPREIEFDNVSPEVTLSYRPSRDLTIYGSYKEGFLSGGFNATNPNTTSSINARGNLESLIDPRYGQQEIAGFEGGVKAALLDGDLLANFAVFDYETTGLQVAVLVGVTQELRNAGEVRTRGAEFDFTYRTPLDGLSLNGALSYLDGEYTDYQSICYSGLPAPECQVQVNRFTGEAALLTDLSGTELVRAPDWTGTFGVNYETPEFSGMRFELLGNFFFTDSFFTDVISSPGGRQPAYQLFDAGLTLKDAGETWELSLLGRNLTDERYFTRSAGNPFSGSAPGGTGTVLADTVAVTSRGRQVWLRATYRFGN
ncbi:TonB-dependent receptor [uncultured Croceicoccus sp.]|uniref:TonB-dependent receptor n=1 Tax=uncultured Croceicoccus sp. TaxID=1295329 RepID=UPI00262C4087|nr:TonB-dependent receptor [uncultured Croceicoccus sp.]